MLKHYVEFFYPGSFVSETSVKEVASRDAGAELPKGAYGYRFFDREEVEQAGEVLRGQAKNHSPMTYYGRALTLPEVEMLKPAADYRILVSNMTINKYERVVRTVRGNFQPLQPGDIVIPA